MEARILGVIRLKKNGVENDRIVTCPPRVTGVAQTTDAYTDIGDLPQDTLESLCRFLVEYSAEEDNKIKFKCVQPRKKAKDAIAKSAASYRKNQRG